MKVNIYKIKNNGKRKYAHFDMRLGLKETCKYISNPENIVKHNFYPFIYYEKKMYKFNKEKGKNEKTRPICYAAHIDRCIYQYYAYILNYIYNKNVCELNIDDCSIAYRDNKRKSNIDFAKEVFDFIKLLKNQKEKKKLVNMKTIINESLDKFDKIEIIDTKMIVFNDHFLCFCKEKKKWHS